MVCVCVCVDVEPLTSCSVRLRPGRSQGAPITLDPQKVWSVRFFFAILFSLGFLPFYRE